ncbi:MAG: hypothetical protein QF486_00760 [Candidatus Woesearchaeota archaeon]|nr:hypothetical protein [Candidatus Woesearchaeota archaeon]MDP7181249.1 hypothetical protein [Candidatus Woesearchaeota archaeon]MDP7198132.1 hypothetical protein [Candidatus Woesearchaeota archaeon]MDP7466966.1 hypothetical protein [Candidatus Woesearchaeota archaeon]MDP7646948.1 hypothetical protein [Candidatus Woesearchaeota archaeon]
MIDFLQNASPEELQARITLEETSMVSIMGSLEVLCDQESIGYVRLILWESSKCLHWDKFKPFEYVSIGRPLKPFQGRGVGTLVHALALKEYEHLDDDYVVNHSTIITSERERHLLSMGTVFPIPYLLKDHRTRCYRAAALRGFDFPMTL